MATINYADKVAINVNPNIPEINKVTDGNMNLIKQVGNQILTTMGVYTDDWNSSTTYAIGDIVIYDNRIFRNLTGTNTETTPDLDTTNWEETTIAAMAGGADIPIRPTAPSNPQDDDLWIDTSDNAVSGANVLNEYSTSNQDVYSCDYTNNLFMPREIENGGNDWKKVDLGFCKIYFINKSNTNSNTYNQNSWGYAFGITYPTNFTYDTTKSIFVGNAKCNDNAVVFNVMAGTNGINVNYTNHYNSSITAAASYCCLLIDFS